MSSGLLKHVCLSVCLSICSLFHEGHFCPVCLAVYRNDETDLPMVCCDFCDRWIHIGEPWVLCHSQLPSLVHAVLLALLPGGVGLSSDRRSCHGVQLNSSVLLFGSALCTTIQQPFKKAVDVAGVHYLSDKQGVYSWVTSVLIPAEILPLRGAHCDVFTLSRKTSIPQGGQEAS